MPFNVTMLVSNTLCMANRLKPRSRDGDVQEAQESRCGGVRAVTLRSFLYRLARLVGNINALQRGPRTIAKRKSGKRLLARLM